MSAGTESNRFYDVRMRGFRDRTDVDAVLELIRQRVQPLPAEEVSLPEAAGRVLATDVLSQFDVPQFDRAAMDGYALHGEETFGAGPYNPLEFRVIGEARPGRAFAGVVALGEAVRIMTGAPLPDGCDAVLPAENAEPVADTVRAADAVPPGKHVGSRGEDVRSGDRVLHAGRRLRPQDVAVLASIGVGSVQVIRRPSVRLVITGDELLPPGSRPESCRIVDSNSVMLAALVQRDGGIPEGGAIIPDQRDLVQSAICDNSADVTLVSGGTSVGSDDHAPAIVAAAGELLVHGVAMRPSSPTGLGFIAGRPVFLLPGNPVSCLAAYDFFAGPTIRALGGLNMAWPYRSVNLPLRRKLVSIVGRVDYVRVFVRDGEVEPLATSGAAILSSTVRADGFVIVPRDSEGFGPGHVLSVFHYD